MKQDLKQIKEKVVPILKEAGITRSSLFGSFVRGEQRKNSDVDILVKFPAGISLFGVIGLQHKLEGALGRKVDLINYKTIKPRLKKYILTEQVRII